MMRFVTRMLIVAAVVVSVYVAVAILLLWGHRMTGNIALVMIILASLAIAINYLYWLPRYKLPEQP